MEYTLEQIQNWRKYERVRAGGKYNMYDPRARQATRLSSEDYSFVMTNYSELKELARPAESKPK